MPVPDAHGKTRGVTPQKPSARYIRGIKKAREVDPEQVDQVIAGLKDVAPDLARMVIEFAFGEIYSRPGLDLKSRQIANIAALTALGHAQPQLKVHINGALNVGCSRKEVVEVIMQMAIYAGFPASINGMKVAKDVFAERALRKTDTRTKSKAKAKVKTGAKTKTQRRP